MCRIRQKGTDGRTFKAVFGDRKSEGRYSKREERENATQEEEEKEDKRNQQ